jgi:hypothetical protein
MHVILFGATGGLGQWTWKAAVAAGHRVTAFVRSPQKLDATARGHSELQVVRGDVMDGEAVRVASEGCDVAINCTSPAAGNSTLEMAKSIVDHASKGGVARFYMVGGMGALWAPGTGKSVLMQDWEDSEAMLKLGLPANIPREMIRYMTKGHLAAMAYLEQAGVAHTFVCPGAMDDAPATADRVVSLDEPRGRRIMRVSMGDVAQVIVDDLDQGELLGHRVCVASG